MIFRWISRFKVIGQHTTDISKQIHNQPQITFCRSEISSSKRFEQGTWLTLAVYFNYYVTHPKQRFRAQLPAQQTDYLAGFGHEKITNHLCHMKRIKYFHWQNLHLEKAQLFFQTQLFSGYFCAYTVAPPKTSRRACISYVWVDLAFLIKHD